MGFICRYFTTKTIEEIVAANCVGMSDAQKAQYWYELSQTTFALLGKVDINRFEITPDEFVAALRAGYSTIQDIKIADSKFFITDEAGLKEVLTRDWVNLVPYQAEIGDCDKFGLRLYLHCCDYYQINSVIPVWGDTDRGYHGFNLAVLKADTGLTARLIEPQSDSIFVENGPLGRYIPRAIVRELGTLKFLTGVKT